jgi:hypothetical protein
VPPVTRVDRLARSIGDLQDIARTIKAKDAGLRATEQPIDTRKGIGFRVAQGWFAHHLHGPGVGLPRVGRRHSVRAVVPAGRRAMIQKWVVPYRSSLPG